MSAATPPDIRPLPDATPEGVEANGARALESGLQQRSSLPINLFPLGELRHRRRIDSLRPRRGRWDLKACLPEVALR